VARAAIAASRSELGGAQVFNLGGTQAHMRQVVDAIEAAAPEAAGSITFDDVQLPIPGGLEANEPLPLEWTPLADGVRATIEAFRAAA
jgi:nucleoside-diphosphate-sugar epimerase